ncbi:GNAT family N-acetyltransferase [Lachnospiraceae bacterium 62-35]
MEYMIRQARMEDLDGVAEVEYICFPPAEAADKASLQKRLEVFPDSFFVAEIEDGKIIGFINGAVTDERTIRDEMFENADLHKKDGRYQSIFGLDVLPEYQRQGVAASLLEHFIKTAEKRGKNGVILTCKEGLIPYYSRFGFKNLGVSGSVHGGAVWYDMVIENICGADSR